MINGAAIWGVHITSSFRHQTHPLHPSRILGITRICTFIWHINNNIHLCTKRKQYTSDSIPKQNNFCENNACSKSVTLQCHMSNIRRNISCNEGVLDFIIIKPEPLEYGHHFGAKARMYAHIYTMKGRTVMYN